MSLGFLFKRRASGGGGGPTTLNPPVGLSAVATSPTTIRLDWTDGGNVNLTGFEVWRGDGEVFGLHATTVAETYEDTDLTTDEEYFYRVRAYWGAVVSEFVGPVSATPTDNTVDAPSGMGVEVTGPTEVTLTWDDNSDNEVRFGIYRSTNGGSFTRITGVGSGTETTTDTTISSGNVYCYYVVAEGAEEDSAPSGTVCVSLGAPSAPTDFEAVDRTTVSITFAWSHETASGAGEPTEFQIYRNDVLYTTVDPEEVSEVVVGLTEGTGWSWKIRASNIAGNSAFTTPINAGTRVAAPTNLTAIQYGDDDYGYVRFTWVNNSSDPAGYRLEKYNGSVYAPFASLPVLETTEWDLSPTEADNNFQIVTLAFSPAIESDPSNPVIPPWPEG